MDERGPQLENGHTRIANTVLENILLAGFSKRELLIIFAVIRATYGWQKKEAELSNSAIAEMTGVDRCHVYKSVQKLAKIGMLLKRQHNCSQVLGINKNYVPDVAKSATLPKQPQTCGQNGNIDVAKTATQRARYRLNKIKERNKEKFEGADVTKTVTTKGTRLTMEFSLPAPWRAWTQNTHPGINPDTLAEEFRDYWVAIPGQRGLKTDWFATWRNRCRTIAAYRRK